ncbi:AAA family ATPase [Bradyrhizobium sp. SZCCHNS3053]|uniref:AAA family ATPase n=1 Tax=Bradyrhizobium sp. SZCCHNS3053 TaxID=3057322 RepID=UPI00291679AB|nr:AAA family ATPase [Bradyrhizobium sp. SZCCHNS3053]
MKLISAKVGPLKSIETPTEVKIEDHVTVLVGMNEAGKTVFLQGLQKSDDVFGLAKFDYVEDYPRKNLTDYERRHDKKPDMVTTLRFQLSSENAQEINATLHTQVPNDFMFSVEHYYNNNVTISISVDDTPAIATIANQANLSTDFRSAVQNAKLIHEIPVAVANLNLTDADKAALGTINARIQKVPENWRNNVLTYEVWQELRKRLPIFMYFGDYDVLPSKMNLPDLARRVAEAKEKPTELTTEHRGILALLRMANITVDQFANPGPLEALIARIESVSIKLTDQIMEFWKQNEDLQVKIEIRPDPNDEPPYNSGPNLYIRISNNKHRGVSTPFRQRSRGFIWFFSFLTWFDSVQHQLEADHATKRPVILLLDEPALSLHALAQGDFLRYIDDLAQRHQVIYSTHSPFMVHSDRLHEVRVVEDRARGGTVISDNVSWTDERTIFPLQAALGWTVAQNLFISERNLLVEGSADLVYLQAASSILESQGKAYLRPDITIVPAGGLDKVVTFIALLNANKLRIAVFHDYRGAPEQKLLDMMREKLIASKAVLDASQFRDLAAIGKSGKPSDTEDLFEPATYLHYFNEAFKDGLLGTAIAESDLPAGDRIIERLDRYMASKGIQLRPSAGFNHYLPAIALARDPSVIDATTLRRFEALFKAVNALF